MPTGGECPNPEPKDPANVQALDSVVADLAAVRQKCDLGPPPAFYTGTTGPTGPTGSSYVGDVGPVVKPFWPSGDPMQSDVDEQFKYHNPTHGQIKRMNAMRETAHFLASLILEVCPHSADRTVAIRKLRECIMNANASIMIPRSGGPIPLNNYRPDFEKETPLAKYILTSGVLGEKLKLREPEGMDPDGLPSPSGPTGVIGVYGPHPHKIDEVTGKCRTCGQTDEDLIARGDRWRI